MTTLSNAEIDKILSRVRKMMNLANNAGAAEGERDNALRMAHATLAKYNLELSDATAANPKAENTSEKRKQLVETFLGTLWARQIAQASAKLFFCMYFYSKISANTDNVRHYFIGRHSNVVTAQEMSKYLIASVHREAKAYQQRVGGTYAQYRSFATGAMLKIYDRCNKLRAESERPAPVAATQGAASVDRSMALAVIYKNEESENEKFLVSLGTKVREGKARGGRVDGYAVEAGKVYGASVSLNRQLR
jgi:hypothetical protein